MIFKKTINYLLISLLIIVGLTSHVSAQGKFLEDSYNDSKIVAQSAGYDSIEGDPENRLMDRINSLISVVLSLVGTILIVIILYAGFLYMTAGGNDEQIGKAKKYIINSVIGLIIVLSAYGIAKLIITSVAGSTTDNAQIYLNKPFV